jgi:streptogramin lyase
MIPVALAIDTTGDVWIADSDSNTITELDDTGTPVGSGYTFGNSSDYSNGVAIDGLNNVWIAANDTIVELNPMGAESANSPITTDVDLPNGAIAIDGSNNVWFENDGTSAVTELTNQAALVGFSGNELPAPSAFVAIDGTGQLWAPQGSPASGEYSFSFPGGVLLENYSKPSSMIDPAGVCVDGAGHIWTTANGNEPFGPEPNISEITSTGAVLSPGATGYQTSEPSTLTEPLACESDTSGNLWVIANTTSFSKVVEFIGLTAPTIAPLSVAVKNNMIGKLP